METKRAGQSGWWKEAKDWAKSIALALIVALLLQQFVFNISVVEGQSMEPTLEDSDRLFVNRAVYLLHPPARGDIVILKNPRDRREGKYLVKRIIGIPGDQVEIRNNRLYVNGELYDDPSAWAPVPAGDYGPLTVPVGHYFVLGDNRGNSLDSRYFGLVPERLVKGRAEFIVWPPSEIGGL